MKRPNILWMTSDQHHAGCMGHAERPEVRTPNLDALANNGTSYTRAYCNSPICGPSRCSMITGLHPHGTGITGNDLFDLDVENPRTLATLLREHGYRTGLIGKGHMVGRWDRDGFETRRYCDLCDAADGDPLSVDYYRHLHENGLADRFDLGARRGGQPGAGQRAFVSEIPEEHCVETWTGNAAVDFVEQEDDRPFFLWLSFQRPHEPLAIPPERADDYDPARIRLPDNAADFFERRFGGKPAYQRDYVNGGRHGYPYRPDDEADLRRQLAAYYTLVTMIDRQIGRVIDELELDGRYDDTLILYTADHGDFAGEHGLQLKNLGIYEAVHRVPLIVKLPGRREARSDAGLRQLVDLYPTVCEAVGIDPPPNRHGRSLADAPAKAVFCEWDFLPGPAETLLAIRSEQHRLVFNVTNPQDGELYDMTSDAGELKNIWHDPAVSSLRAELTGKLLTHLARLDGGVRRRWSFRDDRRTASARFANNHARHLHAGVAYDASTR